MAETLHSTEIVDADSDLSLAAENFKRVALPILAQSVHDIAPATATIECQMQAMEGDILVTYTVSLRVDLKDLSEADNDL